MKATRARRPRVAASLVALAILPAGCQLGSGADKAGGDTIVLKLATIDEVNNNGQSFGPQAFVDGLAQISGGRIKIEILANFGGGAADAESQLVRAIAAGEVDGGWPATRAFAGAGINGLAIVEAPLVISSYAAEKELVSGPIAEQLLARVDGSGVLGLSLAVGPLRRPFAASTPLLGPDDWTGVTFRVFNSPTQSEAVRALGGTAVNLGFEWIDEISEGKLGGGEFDIPQYAVNGYRRQAGNISANVVLWPKVFVLSMNKRRFDSLTAQQQAWVREAATRATQASVDATYDENTPARDLCTRGARFQYASDTQLAALRSRVQPILDGFARSAEDAALLADLQAIANRHPGPVPLDVSKECREGLSVDGAHEPIPATVAPIPDGIYRVEITAAEVVASPYSSDDGLSGTWTLKIAHGTYELSCRPLANVGIDCGHTVYDGPLDVGDIRGDARTAHFVYRPDRLAALTGCELPASRNRPGHCAYGLRYWMDWVLQGDRLTFSNFGGEWTNYQFVIEPWQKIA